MRTTMPFLLNLMLDLHNCLMGDHFPGETGTRLLALAIPEHQISLLLKIEQCMDLTQNKRGDWSCLFNFMFQSMSQPLYRNPDLKIFKIRCRKIREKVKSPHSRQVVDYGGGDLRL